MTFHHFWCIRSGACMVGKLVFTSAAPESQRSFPNSFSKYFLKFDFIYQTRSTIEQFKIPNMNRITDVWLLFWCEGNKKKKKERMGKVLLNEWSTDKLTSGFLYYDDMLTESFSIWDITHFHATTVYFRGCYVRWQEIACKHQQCASCYFKIKKSNFRHPTAN